MRQDFIIIIYFIAITYFCTSYMKSYYNLASAAEPQIGD